MRFIFVLILSGTILAHENWILSEPATPEKGKSVGLVIGGGHDFPTSAFALKDKMLVSQTVYFEGGNVPFQTQIEKHERQGTFEFQQGGAHLFEFKLSRPGLEKILYVGRAVLSPMSSDISQFLNTGKDLEIVLKPEGGEFRVGTKVQLVLLMDGKAIQAPCTVVDPKGKHELYRVRLDEPTQFSFKTEGTYFIFTSFQGCGSSLTFHVMSDSEKGKP